MKKIAYLSSKVTLPGSPIRRSDAFEHDRMMDALRPAFKAQGMSVHDVDWADETANWSDFDAALIGTTWDYWDHWDTFLETLANIEAQIPLFNGAKLVRWNSHKGYLRDLEAKGALLIPTLWIDQVTPQNAADAFDTLGSETLVFKRQVGAGADGQYRLQRGDILPDMPNPMMVQPFLPKIVEEGEISFIFVDGDFSHALIKRAAKGDYRIQSTYGGTEEAITPSTEDLSDAKTILGALDVPPLYARVDMLRGDDGGLLLMEMELIEPYLYPIEGPELGGRMAAAIKKRLG
jgi:glutathione synthase/RimK-type ligase-like ATP-grasp enzyme